MKNFKIDQADHKILILLLTAVSYVLLMFGNGIVSLTHPDEVFYTQTAKEMVARGSWMTPYIFDVPQFEKPIFFYWLLAGAIKLFGLKPFVARFWPAAFGMLGVMVTYGIAWTMFRNKRISFFSALILTSSFIYIALSRAILTDMVFSIWVVCAMASFFTAYKVPAKKTAGLIGAFVFSGLAVLTKGLLGLCFPLAAVVAFLFYKKDFGFLRCRTVLWGILLFLAIALPWHAVMYKLYGQEFLREYWNNVHLRRLSHAEHPKCDTWYFYLGIMFAGVMPWSLFLGAAVWRMIRHLRNKQSEARDAFMFMLFWILSVFVFVQPAHSKLASYIFPVFPALAIVLGHYIAHVVREEKGRRIFCWIGYLWAAVLAAGSALIIVFAGIYKDFVPGMAPVYVVSFLTLLCAAGIFIALRKRHFAGVPWGMLGVSGTLLVTLLLGRPGAEPWVSCKQISDRLEAIDQSDTVVLSSKFYVRGVRYYVDRPMAVIDINGKGFFSPHPIPFLNTEQKVLDFLASQPVTYAVVKEGDRKALERLAPQGGYAVSYFDDIGGKHLLKIENIKAAKSMVGGLGI